MIQSLENKVSLSGFPISDTRNDISHFNILTILIFTFHAVFNSRNPLVCIFLISVTIFISLLTKLFVCFISRL